MEKVLVKVYVPMIEKIYDLWIPSHKKIYNVIILLVKAINELSNGNYQVESLPYLYDKITGIKYDVTISVKESNIRNGTELILM